MRQDYVCLPARPVLGPRRASYGLGGLAVAGWVSLAEGDELLPGTFERVRPPVTCTAPQGGVPRYPRNQSAACSRRLAPNTARCGTELRALAASLLAEGRAGPRSVRGADGKDGRPAVEGTTAASRQHRHRNNILGAPVAGQEWLAPEWAERAPAHLAGTCADCAPRSLLDADRHVVEGRAGVRKRSAHDGHRNRDQYAGCKRRFADRYCHAGLC